MSFFKTKCITYSCSNNKLGICNKSLFDKCPKTTTPNNNKVREYNQQRKDKYKK
jgi:hypothetical protein